MNKFFTIIGVCCILPIILIGIIWFASNKSANQTTQSGSENLGLLGVGSPFPEFSTQGVGGGRINNDSLKGKPAIVWFTTTWCTPCQIGARMVAQLEKELGGNTLNVIVFFVDPRESESDLLKWRSQFANPHWHIAFNNGLAEKLGIQFLDSKYILDQDGVIKNFDTQIVNQRYLDLIKSFVK